MRRILAVDDNDDILEVIKFVLEDFGYTVDTLSDGQYLFEKIKEHTPDLILLDIMLGNMDGRDLCKHIKEREETHKIPVIMISASHTVASTLSYESGAPDDFLAKPFDIYVLVNKVERQLNNAA
jgi:DNA-binding response OmpR family regulator